MKSTGSWVCDQLKTSNLSADNFKKTRTLGGSTPEPAIWSCDTGQQIPCFDSCQLTTTWMCNIRFQAPTLAKKCEILLVGLWCGRFDGRMVTQVPICLGWIDHHLSQLCGSARAGKARVWSSAIITGNLLPLDLTAISSIRLKKAWSMSCLLNQYNAGSWYFTKDGDGSENVAWNSEFACFQTSSQLFQITYFVKCRGTLVELNP